MHLFQAVTGLGGQPSKFRDICTPQERWKKHLNIVKGNPNHVSVVIERTASSKIAFKKPYLLFGLEKNCTVHELRQNIRNILELSDKDSIILFCNRLIPNNTQRIKNLERFVEPDGFLYFYVSQQQSFGCTLSDHDPDHPYF